MKLTLTLLCFLFTLPALASDRKAKAFWNCAKGSCWVITETEKPVPETTITPPGFVAAPGPALEPGMHSHQCPRCNVEWQHADGSSMDSHKCPGCGQYQFAQHRSGSSGVINYSPPRRSIFRRSGG